MEAGDKWVRLEETLRRILREELQALHERILADVREEISRIGKKTKIGFENGRFTGISEEQMNALQAAYGSLDLDTEIKRAAAWIASNPMKAPKTQHGRFLNAWLAKAQNQASLHSIPTGRPTEHKMKHCSYCPKVATSAPGGIWACHEHMDDALERKPRGHMWGVEAKPVAGRD